MACDAELYSNQTASPIPIPSEGHPRHVKLSTRALRFCEDDFPSKDMIKRLLTNSEYPKLTPIGNKVDESIKTNAALVRAGCTSIYSAELTKRAMMARDSAYATTSVTYCVHKVFLTIPKLATDHAKAVAAVELKTALEAKHFALPPSIKNRLDLLEKAAVAVTQPKGKVK